MTSSIAVLLPVLLLTFSLPPTVEASTDYVTYTRTYTDRCPYQTTCTETVCERKCEPKFQYCQGCCDLRDCNGGPRNGCPMCGPHPNFPCSCARHRVYKDVCENKCREREYTCTNYRDCTKTEEYRVYTPSVVNPVADQVVYSNTLTVRKSADPVSNSNIDKWEWEIFNQSGVVVSSGTVGSGTTLQTNVNISNLPEGWYSVRIRQHDYRGNATTGWSKWSSVVRWYRRTNHAPHVPSIVEPTESVLTERYVTVVKSNFSDPDQGDANSPANWRTQGGWELEVVIDGKSQVYSVNGTRNDTTIDLGQDPATVLMRVRQRDAQGAWSNWSAYRTYDYTGLMSMRDVQGTPNPVRTYERLEVTVHVHAPRMDEVTLVVTFNNRPVTMTHQGGGIFTGRIVVTEPEGTYPLTATAYYYGKSHQRSVSIVVSGEVTQYIWPGNLR